MKAIKRTALSLLLVLFVVFFCACASFNPALNNSSRDPNTVQQPELDDDPTNDFTVTLRLNEQPYVPTTAINVYWRNSYDIYIAPVDENGVARIDGLDDSYDASYKVTLSNVPYGYAYDPNAYVATNTSRAVVIDMYDLNVVRGTGNGLYNCYEMSGTGVYSVTVTEPGDSVFFEFAPQTSGTYTVESWVDVNDDGINPIATAYYGSSNYKYAPYRVTDEGACGSYTRNFVHTIQIASQMISSSGGGQQTFTFEITAEPKNGVYPVTISFAIKRNGDFDLNTIKKTWAVPQADWSAFDFNAFNALAGGTIKGAETLYKNTTGAWIFDEDNYKIWKITEGGDGVYHVYDQEKYPATNGYGPILVAYISEKCRFLDKPFTLIESDSKALTVNGTENYKQFIEGYEAVASAGFYCVSNCPCHRASDPIKACPLDEHGNKCPNCHYSCTPCERELFENYDCYAKWCNADGVAPVTKELAEFLQKFAISQRYFADGDGWAEKSGIDAYEDSQWLFACGYYE